MNLVGVTEVRQMLGVTDGRVHQLLHTKRFPQPINRLSAGYVWLRRDIVRFQAGKQPLPREPLDILGVTEAADLLGVSKQRVHQLSNLPEFPKPVARLRLGNIWTRDDLVEFLPRWFRQSGPRPKPEPSHDG